MICRGRFRCALAGHRFVRQLRAGALQFGQPLGGLFDEAHRPRAPINKASARTAMNDAAKPLNPLTNRTNLRRRLFFTASLGSIDNVPSSGRSTASLSDSHYERSA